jgi:hypothetical protein
MLRMLFGKLGDGGGMMGSDCAFVVIYLYGRRGNPRAVFS